MDTLLDNLFNGLKSLEGRYIPRGWSAALVTGSVLGIAALVTVMAFVVFSH